MVEWKGRFRGVKQNLKRARAFWNRSFWKKKFVREKFQKRNAQNLFKKRK